MGRARHVRLVIAARVSGMPSSSVLLLVEICAYVQSMKVNVASSCISSVA